MHFSFGDQEFVEKRESRVTSRYGEEGGAAVGKGRIAERIVQALRVAEVELLRLTGAVLDCPLPPLVAEIDPATLEA